MQARHMETSVCLWSRVSGELRPQAALFLCELSIPTYNKNSLCHWYVLISVNTWHISAMSTVVILG